jgi:hypothetical protein
MREREREKPCVHPPVNCLLNPRGTSTKGLESLLQWAPLNGIMVNGIMVIEIMVNGIMVTGIMVTGIMVTGIMVNGIMVNGIMVSGVNQLMGSS